MQVVRKIVVEKSRNHASTIQAAVVTPKGKMEEKEQSAASLLQDVGEEAWEIVVGPAQFCPQYPQASDALVPALALAEANVAPHQEVTVENSQLSPSPP